MVGKEVPDPPAARHALLSPAPRRKSLRPPSATALLPGPPKVCKIMAFMAIIGGFGLLFYILLGFR